MRPLPAHLRLLLVQAETTSLGPTGAFHLALRGVLGACFLGYGIAAVITTAAWIPSFELFGIPEWLAWPMMPWIGTASATCGLIILFHPCRALLVAMGLWAVFLAAIQPWTGPGWWALLTHSGHIGPALVLLLLASTSTNGWFERIEASPPPDRLRLMLVWILRATVALCLVGHAAELVFSEAQQPPFAGSGFAATEPLWPLSHTTLRESLAAVQLVLAVAVLFSTARPLLLTIAYLQIIQVWLMPPPAGLPRIAHWLSQAGTFLPPFALGFLEAAPTAPKGSEIRQAAEDHLHLIRVAVPALAFCAALASAHVWLRIDTREREHSFADIAALTAAGYDHSGWLPRDLPASARLIHEVHDLTSRTALGAFHVNDPGEFESLREKLRTTGSRDATCLPPAMLLKSEPHWSSALMHAPQRLDLIAGTDNRSFALDPDTGQVFFWTCD